MKLEKDPFPITGFRKMKLDNSSFPITGFRTWMRSINGLRGHRPIWPKLLGLTFDSEFVRQVDEPLQYSGEVFIDRDEYIPTKGDREEHLVVGLYKVAQDNEGCLELEGERIWLLGFQWPTQGANAEKKRQADLVGLTKDGGLVVFEAKAAKDKSKGTAPIHAICEGLDYLSCLLRPGNFSKIESGFDKWLNKGGKRVPSGFGKTKPTRSKKPWLIVLAPENYYVKHARSKKSGDWHLLADPNSFSIPSVEFRLMVTDFKSPVLTPPNYKRKNNAQN